MTTAHSSSTCALNHYGVIRAQGADAADFIHKQLTQDFLLLPTDQARLSLWCTPQGRALASFYGWKADAETVYLLLAADSVDFILKRLKMFVLRSKVTLHDVTADWHICGHIVTTSGAGAAPAALALQASATGWRLQLPQVSADGLHYERHITLQASANSQPPASADQSLWDWLQVRSGVAWVGAALREAWVPQMLNYESLGGINFKKGCYPGQEVVARSQFRGQIKRRTYLVASTGPLTVMQAVLAADGSECGSVSLAASHPDGQSHHALITISSSAATNGLSCHGQALTLLPLPYPLLDDI